MFGELISKKDGSLLKLFAKMGTIDIVDEKGRGESRERVDVAKESSDIVAIECKCVVLFMLGFCFHLDGLGICLVRNGRCWRIRTVVFQK